MFQWTMTLTGTQVMMLLLFNRAEPDEHGSCFETVNKALGDMWDHRAVRKLAEEGLLVIKRNGDGESVHFVTWNITDRGRKVCELIEMDSKDLENLSLRAGREQRRLINNTPDPVKVKKMSFKKICRLAEIELAANGWSRMPGHYMLWTCDRHGFKGLSRKGITFQEACSLIDFDLTQGQHPKPPDADA